MTFIITAPSSDKITFLWSNYSYEHCVFARVLRCPREHFRTAKMEQFFTRIFSTSCDEPKAKKSTPCCTATGPSGKINRNRRTWSSECSHLMIFVDTIFLWAMKYESWRYTTLHMGLVVVKNYYIYTHNCSLKLEGKCWKKAFMFKYHEKWYLWMLSFNSSNAVAGK